MKNAPGQGIEKNEIRTKTKIAQQYAMIARRFNLSLRTLLHTEV